MESMAAAFDESSASWWPHQQFLDRGTLSRRHVIGGIPTPRVMCPRCRRETMAYFGPSRSVRWQSTTARRISPPRHKTNTHAIARPNGGWQTFVIDSAAKGKADTRHRRTSRWGQLDPALKMPDSGRVPLTTRGEAERNWKPRVGAMCMARYDVDREWYLAEILKIDQAGVHVRFKSRGNSNRGLVQASNLRPVVGTGRQLAPDG